MSAFRALAAAALLVLPAPARAERYAIVAGDEGTLVKFVSKAPMETFEGKTRVASGQVELDPAAPGDRLTISVVVDMKTLETGIGLRDRHMRENHLETDRFPEARFDGARVVAGGDAPLVPGETRLLVLAGTLTIHGVPREVELPVDLAWHGSRLTIASTFPVKLSDHGIPRPTFLVMKLGEVQRVEVALVAARMPDATAPAPAGTPAPDATTD